MLAPTIALEVKCPTKIDAMVAAPRVDGFDCVFVARGVGAVHQCQGETTQKVSARNDNCGISVQSVRRSVSNETTIEAEAVVLPMHYTDKHRGNKAPMRLGQTQCTVQYHVTASVETETALDVTSSRSSSPMRKKLIFYLRGDQESKILSSRFNIYYSGYLKTNM